MSGQAKGGNSFIKTIVFNTKKAAPQLIHECPYTGLHETENITLVTSFMSVFPKGSFRLKIFVSDEINSLLNFIINFSIV